MLEVEIERLGLPTTEMIVLVCAEGCATLVAVTVTGTVVVTAGAVNRPVEEITPELAVQVTAGLLTLLTRALSWMCPFELTLGVVGVIVIFVHD